MTQVVQNYLARYFDPSLNESVMRRRSLEEAKKFQAFYEYLDLDRERLLRQKEEPSGLRNIGNTCYFNVFMQLLYHINSFRDMFLQGTLRSQKGERSTLPCELQNLFGQMLFSKFAYCDPSEAFLALNRSNPDKIQLGDQYDLNEYFSITLDTIEKCLAKEPSLQARAKILDRVFYGKMNQHFDDGKEVSTTPVKFGVINLDVKQGSLEKAFDLFKNYSVDGYKSSAGKLMSAKVRSEITAFPQLMTFYVNRVEFKEGKLTKNNGKFTYPEILQFNKDSCEYRLNKESDELERKIARVQKLIEEKEYSKLLESLRNTESFLEMQEFDDIGDMSLGIKELNYNFGVFGGDQAHDDSKKRLRHYIEKLEKQEKLLETTLENLKEEKKKLSEKYKTTQYNLFAVMMHQGSAVSGHYFIYIYNENQRKWRKFSDRFIVEVSAEQVHRAAMSMANSSTNASCLIYKNSDFKCDPFLKPPVSASLKSSVSKSDEFVAENINRVRIERMLRNCTDIAKEELQYFVEGFQLDPLVCISYFSNPVYYWIGVKDYKLAEFTRLKEMISEPSFLLEANTSQLPPVRQVVIPEMNGSVLPKEYNPICEAIKMALDEESRNNIDQSIKYLLTRRHLAGKIPAMRELYDKILIIFLLKATFYLDLKLQTNQDHISLFELIKFAKNALNNSLFTMQIQDNLRSSMGNTYTDKLPKLTLTESIFESARPAEHINIQRVMFTRFKIWVQFFRQITNRKSLIKQDARTKEQIVQLMHYIK